MLRSYLHLYERNRHKLLVLESMPTLVYAKGSVTQSEIAYNKILEMLIHLGNMGIIGKEGDGESSIPIEALIKLLPNK